MIKAHARQPKDYCRTDKYLTLISTKWTAHIIWLVSQQPSIRFGQIQKQLAFVSSKVLSERLKLLKEEGFIWRREEDTVPASVHYGLTSKGQELADIVNILIIKAAEWDSK